MKSKSLLLLVALVLVSIGIFKPDIGSFINTPSHPSVVVDNLDIEAPKSEALRSKADDIVKALAINNDRKIDGKKLAALYKDIATLIALDGENEVIKNTEDIRQANRLSGLILQLDIKGKYPALPEANQALLIESIGDDSVLLNKELRAKAVEGFMALAWACNKGAK